MRSFVRKNTRGFLGSGSAAALTGVEFGVDGKNSTGWRAGVLGNVQLVDEAPAFEDRGDPYEAGASEA